MKKLTIILLLFYFSFSMMAKEMNVDYVNPLVGTALKGEGGTAPFVSPPFAMTKMIPQTRENKMGTMAYVYDDKSICGFMASHQPTVWMGDYGYVSLMPQIGKQVKVQPKERAMSFSHANEVSTPYSYNVKLESNGQCITADMAASSRASIVRFSFPGQNSRVIIQGINLNPELGDWCNDYNPRMKSMKGWIKVIPETNEIIGYNPDRQSAQIGPELKNFKGYFVIRFNQKISRFGTWNEKGVFNDVRENFGTRNGAFVEFEGEYASCVMAQIGTSFISIEQARENMDKELSGWNLDKLAEQTKKDWERKLGKFSLDGVSEESQRIFFTALYHCYQFPREFSEYGRYYSAMDDQVHKGVSHNDFSLWDTFRAFHPLMTLLEPRLTGDWIQSLSQMYKEGGWMPMWPNPTYTNIMIGTHADAVIADAYVKGIRNFDVNLAYEAMLNDAMVAPEKDTERRYGDRDRWTAYEGRAGMTAYKKVGYVADDVTAESLSRTLEYAYDDWCVAQVAKSLGHLDDYNKLIKWSENYRNVYNKEEGFMLPRKLNGDWIHLDNYDRHGVTEGSKWTYLFFVLQDISGMIEMMGGNDNFSKKLDRNFQENFYKHDNEPGHHYCYLYDYCGQPWKTQALIRKHTLANYHDVPDGLNGNDDCGQMSAWYIFSVMGFYPVTPGSGMYAIGAPQYPLMKVKIANAKGKEHWLTIKATNISDSNKYIGKILVDGKEFNGFLISHDTLVKAKNIEFLMTSNH